MLKPVFVGGISKLKALLLRLPMGCRKLSYYSKDEALSTKQNFLRVVKEKSVCAEKIGIDYFTFGMIMPGRNFQSASGYRFGHGGQEKVDEISGTGNHYTAPYWEYDPRLGRRWNLDPVVAEWESGYAAFRNTPILLNDPNGDCPDCDKAKPDAKAGDTFRPEGADHDYLKGDNGEWSMLADLPEVEISAPRNNGTASDNTNVSMPIPDFTPKTTRLSDLVTWGDNKMMNSMLGKDSPFNLDQKKAIMRHRVRTAGTRFNADPAGGLFMNFVLGGMTMGIGSFAMPARTAFTTSEGFLFGSIGFRTPVNLRVGLYASQNTLKYGSFRFSTIAPNALARNNQWFGRNMLQITTDFQPSLGNWSSQVIPKGTYMRVGLVGPQNGTGLGTWLQIYTPQGVKFIK